MNLLMTFSIVLMVVEEKDGNNSCFSGSEKELEDPIHIEVTKFIKLKLTRVHVDLSHITAVIKSSI